jgi:hypothetical protein
MSKNPKHARRVTEYNNALPSRTAIFQNVFEARQEVRVDQVVLGRDIECVGNGPSTVQYAVASHDETLFQRARSLVIVWRPATEQTFEVVVV